MSEVVNDPSGANPQFTQPTTWQLVVAAVADITPHMRRIQLVSPALTRLEYLPGQDVSLGLIRQDGSAVRRRYTIRRFNGNHGVIDLEFVMHGDGPGMRWAAVAAPGVAIEAVGPRGKITLAAGAAWHLFAGDATALPGTFAMMDALPTGVPAHAFLLVDGPEERQVPQSGDGPKRTVTWRYEAARPSPAGGLVAAVAAADLPAGEGHAYLAGEVGLVSALKAALLSRGWAVEQISAKAYWNRGRANAGHGEPEIKAS